jgi:beta-lactamase regulating signal transducer with metallopeptidase domain
VTFAARGLLVSLAFFAVVYCSLSVLAVIVWRAASWAARSRRREVVRSSNLLFGLRMVSFFVAAGITLFFTFPSFWLMERPSLDEDLGTFVLAACAVVIIGAGIVRLLRDQSRTTRALKEWLLRTCDAECGAMKPALDAAHGAPALILVGIRKPRVMISDAATAMLSEDELQVAIRHEIGHRHSWDNLKKVLISATPFPGMRGMEKAWREAAELAADDAAVENRQEALDLAAALIKLSRSSKQSAEPALASGLVCGSSSITTRVERLLEWRAATHRFRRSWPWTLLVLLTISLAIATHYGATLVLTHRMTELLVP